MGTHLRVLSESYLINTNMTGLDVFQKSSCALGESRAPQHLNKDMKGNKR